MNIAHMTCNHVQGSQVHRNLAMNRFAAWMDGQQIISHRAMYFSQILSLLDLNMSGWATGILAWTVLLWTHAVSSTKTAHQSVVGSCIGFFETRVVRVLSLQYWHMIDAMSSRFHRDYGEESRERCSFFLCNADSIVSRFCICMMRGLSTPMVVQMAQGWLDLYIFHRLAAERQQSGSRAVSLHCGPTLHCTCTVHSKATCVHCLTGF